jgi:hypothetical protein
VEKGNENKISLAELVQQPKPRHQSETNKPNVKQESCSSSRFVFAQFKMSTGFEYQSRNQEIFEFHWRRPSCHSMRGLCEL